MIRAPRVGEFTQGTLFSCAVAQRYEDGPVLGLIITARCDVAHDKAEILNYIPVVPLERWLLRHGRQIVARRQCASAFGAMQKAMTNAGLATTILGTVPIDQIAEELDRGDTKPLRVAAGSFRSAADAYAQAQSAAELADSDANAALAYLKDNDGACKGLIKELVSNGLAEYHFIDSPLLDASHGYVALLREIRLLSAPIARAVTQGLDNETYKQFATGGYAYDRQLIISADDFAMPLAIIDSPYIELIMQRITSLFARIGVTDIPLERVRLLQGIISSMGEEAL